MLVAVGNLDDHDALQKRDEDDVGREQAATRQLGCAPFASQRFTSLG